MKSPYDIIIAPIITEKAVDDMAYNKYTFRVDPRATKPEIARAVEGAFDGVKVARVNTINVPGRTSRYGYHVTRKSKWKKAIVTLTEDSESIEFFEGMN